MDEVRIRFCDGTITRLQMLLLRGKAELQVSNGLLILLTLQADLPKFQARLGSLHLRLLAGVSEIIAYTHKLRGKANGLAMACSTFYWESQFCTNISKKGREGCIFCRHDKGIYPCRVVVSEMFLT